MANLRKIKNTRRKNHSRKVFAETLIVSTIIASMLPLTAQAASKTLRNISIEDTFIGELLLVNENGLTDTVVRNMNVTLMAK